MLKVFPIIAAIQHATNRIKRFHVFLAPCVVVFRAAELNNAGNSCLLFGQLLSSCKKG